MRVLVVGAGPAGAAFSFLLARSGVEVTLFERESDFARTFRGEGLMPSGVDALMQMGLYDLLDSMPTRKLESWDIYVNARKVMRVEEPLEELGDRAMRVIPQSQFLEGIVGRASGLKHFTLRRDVRVRDLLWENGRVVGVEAATPEGDESITADYVVGCDGRGSLVRTKCEIELDRYPDRYDVLWFKMPAPESLASRCRMYLMASNSGMGAAYTSWDGRLQYALMQMKGERHERSPAEWAEALAAPAPDSLGGHIRSVANEFDGPLRLNVITGRAKTWSVPGVLLLGDAAHPMAPIRAQGINTALRDVIVAANHLMPVLNGGGEASAMDAAAKAVQAEREPEIRRSQTLQYQDTRGIGTWYAPMLVSLAGAVGPPLGRYKWAQNAWLRQQRDLRFGSTTVTLLAEN
jgi:2-polyprenyl-6-methoxyphenol hydroxylase-like FAD-dependent oxidoreductase